MVKQTQIELRGKVKIQNISARSKFEFVFILMSLFLYALLSVFLFKLFFLLSFVSGIDEAFFQMAQELVKICEMPNSGIRVLNCHGTDMEESELGSSIKLSNTKENAQNVDSETCLC